MSVGTLISEEEYLRTTYHPDCGFEDGVLIERNVGTISHGRLQGQLFSFFGRREKLWNVTAYLETRIRLRTGKYMIPDLSVAEGPLRPGPILVEPPLLVIEILSPDDRPIRVNDTVRAWREFGVPNVWVIDPETLDSEVHDERGRTRIDDSILRMPGTPIEVPLNLLDED